MNVGDKIPEILGHDQDGNEIKAADYRGRKIVLYSYPKANTSGCTAEACSLQAHRRELEAAGYAIIGVSKDKEALQKKFAEANGLEFPLIADTDTTLLQQLGCWGEKRGLRTPHHRHAAHHLPGERGGCDRENLYSQGDKDQDTRRTDIVLYQWR